MLPFTKHIVYMPHTLLIIFTDLLWQAGHGYLHCTNEGTEAQGVIQVTERAGISA